MRQIPIVFLCVAFFPSARDIIAQEGFIWTDSVVEYRFSSLSDSLPQHKVTNYVREEDSATHLHITASWDTELNAWINEYKSIGISNQVAHKLELQTYYWDDNNTWAGSSRSFFWYDSKEDIMYTRRDIWDLNGANSGWTRQDSIVNRREIDSLVQISENFQWLVDSSSWKLARSWKFEKVRNEDETISDELESRLDTSSMDWIPVSQWVYTYDSLGNLTQMNKNYLVGSGNSWIEYIRKEFYYDSILNLNIEEKYVWDFKKSDWDLIYHSGVSEGSSQIKKQMFGVWDPKFNKWSYFNEVVSEFDSQGLIKQTTFFTRKPYSEWVDISQTRYTFNAEKQPILQTMSNYNNSISAFEVERKKYFYYPLPPVISGNDETFQTSYKAYPNPVSNMLHIEGPDHFQHAEIFNLNGQLLISTGKMEIDMSGLSSGLYLLRISENIGPSKLLVVIKI